MWTPSLLITIATLAGLLTLWRDEIVAVQPKIKENETDEQKNERLEKELKQEKTKRVKLISSLFIILTLLFTIYQILSSNNSTRIANEEKQKQHTADSTRYAVDSIKHITEREEDNTAHKLIDSIRKVQIDAYLAQILAGKSIDNIRSKSAQIVNTLFTVDTNLKSSAKILIKSSGLAEKSFDKLAFSSERLLYMLDDNIHCSFTIGIWNYRFNDQIEKYLVSKGDKQDYSKITKEMPFYDEINNDINTILYDSYFQIEFYNLKQNDFFPILMLTNKNNFKYLPYDNKYEDRIEKGVIQIVPKPTTYFEISYHRPSKSLMLFIRTMDLKISSKFPYVISILDLNNSIIDLQFATQSVRDNPNCLMKLDSSYMNLDINFSDKKRLIYDFVKPSPKTYNKYWPHFIIDSIQVKENGSR